MTMLVTGGCGYLGSQLIRDLAAAGQGVRILDNLSSGRLEALQNLPAAGCEFSEADILDPSSVRRALDGVETVVHLAAIARTPFGFQNPDRLEQVNHWGTAQLVEAALAAGVESFVLASSAAVYGPGGEFSEESPLRPLGPYGESKVGAEMVARSAAERGMKVLILRFGTLFGLAPVTRFDAVANRFAYLAGVGRSLPVYGTGEQRRPLLHVRDASRLLRQLVAGRHEGVWNASAENVSVVDIAEALREARGGVRVSQTETNVLTHLSLELDTRKLQHLGWRVEETLAQGLKEIAKSFDSVTDRAARDWRREAAEL